MAEIDHDSSGNPADVPGSGIGDGLSRIPEALLAQVGLGSWHWDIGPDIVTWSPELLRMFRVPHGESPPNWKDHHKIYEPSSFEKLKRAVGDCLAGGPSFRLLLEARRLDGELFLVEGFGAAGKKLDGKVEHLYGVCVDRSEEFLARRKADQIRQKCEAIFRQADVGLAIVDAGSGVILETNRGLAGLLGMTGARLQGLPLSDLFVTEESAGYHLHSISSSGWPRELPLRRSDNTVAWAQVSMSPILLEGGRAAHLVFIQDVSRRRQAEEARRRAESAIGRAVIDERQQFARYIHDGTGQLLTALSLQTAALKGMGIKDSEARRTADRVHELACEIQRRLRALVRGMAPLEIVTDNFLESLRELADNFSSGFGIPVVARLPDEWMPCCDSVALGVYLIIQEAALNAVRHSGAASVEIGIEVGSSDAVVSVTDDGAGFMPGDRSGGVGIKSMEARAQAVGGSLEIISGPGCGTRVVVRVPHGSAGTACRETPGPLGCA